MSIQQNIVLYFVQLCKKDFLHVAIVDLWAERIINIISFVFVLRHFLNINQQLFSKVEIE